MFLYFCRICLTRQIFPHLVLISRKEAKIVQWLFVLSSKNNAGSHSRQCSREGPQKLGPMKSSPPPTSYE